MILILLGFAFMCMCYTAFELIALTLDLITNFIRKHYDNNNKA